MLKNLFETEGITYRVFDEATNSAAGIGALGSFGARVQVHESDYKKAQTILEKAEL